MISSINDLLNTIESQNFIGREKELQLIQEQITQNKKQWKLLHFHGISGIGKTALLKRFMKITTVSNVLYLDTDKEFQSPKQFLDDLTKVLGIHDNQINDRTLEEVNSLVVHHLNSLAAEDEPLILLFDSFELWQPITEWLFHSFIPKLSADIRVISAGRESFNN